MSNLKNVLYIGGFELPDKNAAAHRVVAIGKILNKIGFQISFIGIDHEIETNDIINSKQEFGKNIRYKYKYPKTIKEWLHYILTTKHIIEIIESSNRDIKIVIAYNYPAIALYRLHKYCKKRNIAIIADSTEWYVPNGNLLFKLIKDFDTNFRMKYVQPKLDGIIVISRFLKNYYLTKIENIIEIPPLVDKNDIKWENNYRNVDSLVRLIYVGSPGAKDKIEIIVQALSMLNSNINLSLDIVGISEEEFREFYKLEDISLSGKFIFHGRLSNTSALNILKQADFSIFIRDNNLVSKAGFPTKFVEAMAAGIPVLTNKTSNIDDFLSNEFNGYFLDYSSTEELASEFKKALILERNTIYQLKENCRNMMSFDISQYTEKLQSFIKKTIAVD